MSDDRLDVEAFARPELIDTPVEFVDLKSDSESTTPVDTVIGALLDGRYEIISLLGRGGWATVYKARHKKLNKCFAIKILHAHLLSRKTSMGRFKREARSISSLDHPNIAAAIDYGVMRESGQPYIVFEYIEGVTLSQWLRTRRQSNDDLLDIFSQVADGLSAAHCQGIVHRDVKPTNIMLTSTHTNSIRAVLIDFGLAKLFGDGGEGASLSQASKVTGSYLYMSPEQCLSAQDLDGRADIYSLGCVMYEAFTGVRPFQGLTLYDCMLKHMTESPTPLIEVAPDVVFPARLQAVIFKALASDKNNRYESAAMLRSDLIALMSRPPTVCPKEIRSYSLRISSRNPSLKIVCISSAILLLAAVLAFWNESPLRTLSIVSLRKMTGLWKLSADESELVDHVQSIEDEISRLRYSGQEDAASALASRLGQCANYAGVVSSGKKELHTVITRNRATVDVNVSYTGNPVVLLLCSNGATQWHVKTAAGVLLERVITASPVGLKEATVSVPPGVDKKHVDDNELVEYLVDFATSKAGKNEVSYRIGTALKMSPATITTQVGNNSSAPAIVLGPQDRDWKLQHRLYRVRELHMAALRERYASSLQALRSITFNIPTYFEGDEAPSGQTYQSLSHTKIAVFSPMSGKVVRYSQALQIDVPLMGSTLDDRKHELYASDGQNILVIDQKSGESAPLGGRKPAMEWIVGLCFDSASRTLKVIGYRDSDPILYNYDVDRQTWQRVADLTLDSDRRTQKSSPDAGTRMLAFAYSAADDCYYALAYSNDLNQIIDNADTKLREASDFKTVLLKYSGRGQLLKEMPASSELFIGTAPHLIVSNKLLILVSDSGRFGGGRLFAQIIDPDSGAILY